MSRRVRILAGVLTLAALTFSFAETVLASVCAPMADMEHMGGMEMGSGSMVGMADGQADDLPGNRDMGGRGENCPLNSAVGAGCTAAASLPVAGRDEPVPADHGFHAVVLDELRPDLLLPHPHFRPPRA